MNERNQNRLLGYKANHMDNSLHIKRLLILTVCLFAAVITVFAIA